MSEENIIEKITPAQNESITIEVIREICTKMEISITSGYYSASAKTPLFARNDDIESESSVTLYEGGGREGINFEYHKENNMLLIGME